MPCRRLGPFCLVALLLLAWSAAGQGPDEAFPPAQFPGESKQTAQRLALARKLAADGKAEEALTELQAILDTAGDDLVAVGPRHCVPARCLCHLALAALPPETRRQYRSRAEPAARKLLDQARATRDERVLRRIVDEAFCTRAGAEALDLLGDLALAAGRFDEAERWWRMVVPLDEARPRGDEILAPVFPDSPLDPARLRAKQLLARLYVRGMGPGWTRDLQKFRAKHESAEGTIGGRKGRYADLLLALAEKARQPETPVDGSWTTFGGDATRGEVIPAPSRFLDRLAETCRNGPDWRFDLEKRRRLGEELSAPTKILTPSENARRLAFHPIFFGNHLLVADARYVTAYDLRTGTVSPWFDGSTLEGWQEPNLRLPAPPDLRYVLTAADGLVFARLGEQDVRLLVEPEPGKVQRGNRRGESYLVCLNSEPARGGSRLRWFVRGSALNGGVFEGAPVAEGGLVWIAATRFNGDQALTTIYCFPAKSNGTPSPRWAVEVCEAREPVKERRYRHHLLTLAGDQIAYCSQSGAVVALDAKTGRRTWAFRYPSLPPRGADTPPRDLTPGVFAAGRLFVAPADSNRLFCLDATSGAVLWEREGIVVLHLLGVGQGRLIFTTPKGLRAVGAEDGDDATGWGQPEDGTLATRGRGLLVGDVVLWPIAGDAPDQIRVLALRQRDGRPVDNPTLLHNVPAGNLLYADGCLAVAGREVLSVFVPPSLRLEERQQQAREHPASAAALLELGRAEADAGLTDRALQSFQQAERLAGSKGFLQGDRVREQARIGRQTLHLLALERSIKDKRWADALAALDRITETGNTVTTRLQALEDSARFFEEAEQPARAVAVWQRVLSSPELRTGQQMDENGLPWNAAARAAEEMDRLRALHGDAVYQEIEKKARGKRAEGNETKATTERLAAEYPNAAVTIQALFEVARQEEKANHPGDAARIYRRLLATTTGENRAEGLVGLARAYERMAYWPAARITWLRLDHFWGKQILASLGSVSSVSEYVIERLQAPEFAERSSDEPLPIGLARPEVWQVRLGPRERVLSTGQPGRDFFLTAEDHRLLARSRADGKPRWEQDLPFVPTWMDCHGDLLLAAGSAGIACLQVENGVIVWKIEAPRSPRSPPETRPDPLSAFRLAAGRLFFLQGSRCLFAIDVETGKPLWKVLAPGAALNLPSSPHFFPAYHAGAETVLVQTSLGRRWLLDAASGQRIQNAFTSREPWARPPVPLDERRLVLVEGARKVLGLDARSGEELWTHSQRGTTTLSGEPLQVLAHRNALLLLIPTNLGYWLQRLDPVTGKPLWVGGARPLGGRSTGTEHQDVAHWSLGPDAVYYVSGRILCAQALRDGRLLWERALSGPEGPWQTLRLSNTVLTYPAEAASVRFQFRWLGAALQWEWIRPPEEVPGLGFPVACCDPETGRLVQRLNFRGAVPLLHWGRDEATVCRAARVDVSATEIFAFVPGHAWGRK